MNTKSVLDRLSTILAVLGGLAVIAALGVYLVLGQLDRWVIVLFAVGLGCWVYAALERPEQTVKAISSRNVRYGSNTLVMSLAFLGILALVNVLANRYSDRLDLTQNHSYTLSPLSVQIVHKLTEPVQVYAFYQNGNPGRDSFKPLLEEYRKESSMINYQFVDPYSQPGLANQYHVQVDGTTVLVSGKKQQSITGSDEGAFTSALLKLERTKSPVVYYLTGHGELDFSSTAQDGGSMAKAAIAADDYDVRSLNLAATGKVPSDAATVIVAGPTTPLLPKEMDALEQYLDGGGKAVILADKRQQSILGPLAKKYGVDIGNGVIVDPGLSMPNDPTTPLIGQGQLQFSPLTKDLPTLILPSATSMTPEKTPPSGLQVQPLALTTDQSWLETDARVAHFDAGTDPKGPLDVLVSVEKASADPSAASSQSSMRVVFVGDVAFAMNGMSQITNTGDLPPGNKAILTNAVNWLTSNEDLIQIQAKPPADQSLILSNTQVNVLLFGSAVFLPLVVLGAGALVWWNRR